MRGYTSTMKYHWKKTNTFLFDIFNVRMLHLVSWYHDWRSDGTVKIASFLHSHEACPVWCALHHDRHASFQCWTRWGFDNYSWDFIMFMKMCFCVCVCFLGVSVIKEWILQDLPDKSTSGYVALTFGPFCLCNIVSGNWGLWKTLRNQVKTNIVLMSHTLL